MCLKRPKLASSLLIELVKKLSRKEPELERRCKFMKQQKTKTRSRKSVLGTLLALGLFSVGCGMNVGNSSNTYSSGTTLGTSGCGVVQVGSSITFSAQNAYVDYYRIISGQLPVVDPMYPNQNVGWMRVNGNGSLGTTNINTNLINTSTLNNLNASSALTGSSYTGSSLQIQITQTVSPYQQNNLNPLSFGGTSFNSGLGYSWYAQPTSQVFANFQGTLSLGINDVQKIVSMFPQYAYYNGSTGSTLLPGQTYGTSLNSYNYNTTTTANQICVSGISMNMGYMNNRLYNGLVYLFLNGTQHGIIVQL